MSPELLEQLTAQITAKVKADLQADADKLAPHIFSTDQETAILGRSEADLAKDEKTMKERILAEPKKTIFIPEDPNNPEDRQAISLNGIIFSVKRGSMVEVPESVAAIWEHSYETTKKVMKRIKVSNITEKEDLEVE